MKLIRKFMRWFNQDYSKPVEKYGEYGNSGTLIKPKWGFIIPHLGSAGGARTPDSMRKNINEYEYGIIMSKASKHPFATRNKSGVKGASKALKKVGAIFSLESHKNAYNGLSRGFEALVLEGDDLSFRYAVEIATQFKASFPDRNLRHGNGVRFVKPNERGGKNLVDAKKGGMEVAILAEPFFIDNPKEWIEPTRMAQFWDKVLV